MHNYSSYNLHRHCHPCDCDGIYPNDHRHDMVVNCMDEKETSYLQVINGALIVMYKKS